MNAAVVKRTQEALGKVIRRPPLTEKLLNKPPFRYLHDIIMEVIRVTGFLKGLYTDAEMKSDNVKEKEAKISFLQKAIDVVALVSGEPPAARPARIVAGHEPERTNELLQLIGRCCLSKLSSDDAVQRVLAGDKGDLKARAAPAPGPAREEDGRARRGPEERRRPEPREGRAGAEAQAGEDRPERQTEPERPREGDRAKGRAKAERERRAEPGRSDRDRWRQRERGRGRGGDPEQERRRLRDGEHPREHEREPAWEQDRPERKSASAGEAAKKASDGASKDPKAETEPALSARTTRSVAAARPAKRRPRHAAEGPTEANSTPASPSEESPAGLWRDGPEPGAPARQKGDAPSDAEGEADAPGQEKSDAPSEPSPGLRLPRPGSARPAPPRVKRQESAEALLADRAGSGRAVPSVIVDSQKSDDEADSQFVVEAAPELAEAPLLETAPAVEFEENEKHGGLVKKILETKKDYEKLQPPPRPGEKEKAVLESAWRKEKDVVSKEIERLRASVQTLCKSALPLGKIMDYVQEDADAMQRELRLWHAERRRHAEALQKEQSVTDGAVEPLKAQLAELEQLIRDQQDKICAVKASVLRNEDRIQRLVRGLSLSSRR